MKVLKASIAFLLILMLAACASQQPAQKDNVKQPIEKEEVTVDQEEAVAPEAEPVIRYVVDTVMHGDTRKTEDDMMKVRNLGRKSLEEVKNKLGDLDLSLRTEE